jgi:hypothetical protein
MGCHVLFPLLVVASSFLLFIVSPIFRVVSPPPSPRRRLGAPPPPPPPPPPPRLGAPPLPPCLDATYICHSHVSILGLYPSHFIHAYGTNPTSQKNSYCRGCRGSFGLLIGFYI